MTVMIYGLVDPRASENVRYIGQTTRLPQVRVAQHVSDVWRTVKNDRKDRWISGLIAQDVMPSFVVIDYVPEEIALQRERYWINEYRRRGFDLLNSDNPVAVNHPPVGEPSLAEQVEEWLDAQHGEFQWGSPDDVPSAREISKALGGIAPSSAHRGRNRWIRRHLS